MKSAITAIALSLMAMTALAQQVTPKLENENAGSNKSREAVKSELKSAEEQGKSPPMGQQSPSPNQPQGNEPNRSRAEVRNELESAVKKGDDNTYGEVKSDGKQ